ncbi:MAG: ATP-binding cassette domain-containing protein [Crenarchaeota archaeon]|nr:ATP-binding cassette domain-containing protein [Thermoproteota archaeon]MDW8033605.1 ATP-binding cassette domain-containing protein [Nitrososphaerota archaeon]
MQDYSIITKEISKAYRKGEGGFPFKRKSQKTIVALDNVNLSIGRGELFGLLGPNGAGKTTLIKILSTLIIPDAGTALVNGYDVLKEPGKVRASIGVVSSGERSLYWKLTARENLEYFARLYKVPDEVAKRRIRELLSLIGLEDRADDLVEKYSSGMRQKLSLVRAILHDPEILLLDEPTLGLDPGFSKSIRSFIREELNKKQGKTILLTTHYMEEADQMCDRVAFINKGRIVAVDTPERLKTMIGKKEVLKVVVEELGDSVLNVVKTLPFLEDYRVTGMEQSSRKTVRMYMKNVDAHIQEIVESFSKAGCRIISLSVEKPTLEDVFINLTGEALGDEY